MSKSLLIGICGFSPHLAITPIGRDEFHPRFFKFPFCSLLVRNMFSSGGLREFFGKFTKPLRRIPEAAPKKSRRKQNGNKKKGRGENRCLVLKKSLVAYYNTPKSRVTENAYLCCKQ